jgi:hypothetical protein
MVPTPEKKRVVVGGILVMIGTRNVAPNIAAMCWSPMPIVRGHERRSSGATTSPEVWTFQEKSDAM